MLYVFQIFSTGVPLAMNFLEPIDPTSQTFLSAFCIFACKVVIYNSLPHFDTSIGF